MKYFILTNNPLAADEFGESHDVRFIEGVFGDVLIEARNLIDKGAVLLVHPLYGSVKPNETPYRSYLLKPCEKYNAAGCAEPDPESLRLIENAITAFNKFPDRKKVTNPSLLQDFQTVDLSLLKTAVQAADR